MKLLLVDAHSLGYFCQQGAELRSGERQVQAIFGMIKNIRKFCQVLKASPIVLWDGNPTQRKTYYPLYKASRKDNPQLKEMRDEFRQQRPDIQLMLSQLGIRQLKAEDGEADDLAAMLVDKFKSKAEHIYLYTGDKDWYQLLDANVSVIPIRKEGIVEFDMLEDVTGYSTTRQFIEAKALHGDKSDEISGVGGIGEKGALELLTEFGSVVNFVRQVRSGDVTIKDLKSRSRKRFFALAENEFNEKESLGMLAIFKRNLILMDLAEITMRPKHVTTIQPAQDFSAFANKCRELNFQSFLDEFEVFTLPFERYINQK